RLKEVLLDGQWIANTNYKDQIESVNYKQATTKISNLNSIALLTFHINYYIDGILNVFDGGTLDIKDKYSFDAPLMTSDKDWEDLKSKFLKNAQLFIDKVNQMDDNQLKSPFVDIKYGSYLRNIEGVIEHSYYHLGQISLLKKMILKDNA
ncbi:MAG: DUF1572 domain-containing protein, partial [Olleya sp.]